MQRSKYLINTLLIFILMIILSLIEISLNIGLVYLNYKLGLFLCFVLNISKHLTFSIALSGFIYTFIITLYILENILLTPFYKLIRTIFHKIKSFLE